MEDFIFLFKILGVAELIKKKILDPNKKWGLLERVILFDIRCILVYNFPLWLMWMSRLDSINSFNLWFHLKKKKACFLFIFAQIECNLCFLVLLTILTFWISYQMPVWHGKSMLVLTGWNLHVHSEEIKLQLPKTPTLHTVI